MRGKDDENYKKSRNNFLLIAGAGLIFVVFIIVLIFRIASTTTAIGKKVKKDESFMVFVTDSNCDYCNEVKNYLDSNGVSYEKLYMHDDEAERYFKSAKLNYSTSLAPAVLYFKKGEFYSSLLNIKDTEELSLFIKNYNLK